jgi:A/G-specific adenine glycosylase
MEFCNVLELWYLENNRDLPWRKVKDPYIIWLSEIILQQTRVAQGMSYYLKFVDAFPTVIDLANADEEVVLKLWQGLGYYSRARNLHFSAKYVVNELNGVFPQTYKELLSLKGVGDYTASAISSICYNESAAVVDGNVYRVLARYYGIDTPINSTKGIKDFKELAQIILDIKNPGQHNQAIMDFGAIQCKPGIPDCQSCPFNDSCVAYEKNLISVLPVKEKKIKIRKRYFNFIVFQTKQGKTRLQQRVGKGIWENLYQFPLVETTESIDVKELIENEDFLNLLPSVDSLKLFNNKDWVHKLSHQHLFVKFWVVATHNIDDNFIDYNKVEDFPVPRIVHRFIEEFDFEEEA